MKQLRFKLVTSHHKYRMPVRKDNSLARRVIDLSDRGRSITQIAKYLRVSDILVFNTLKRVGRAY